MRYKKGQLNSIEDYFKAFVTLIFGIIFITAIIETAPQEIVQTLKSIGYTLIVLGFIILIISLIPRRYFRS